ncbi:MAG: chemotaxis response regulator protein-glutamate methylesterase [Spirochaetia bacterium]|nr:chemotaxis response regulator protein-glutamate methylesterase [Spirochaetia bacterium]
MGKIKVLVVDDSAFMRKIIPDMLNEDPGIEVIGTARDGKEAFKKAIELAPDVITLDVEMPGLDGLHTLGYIMSEKPTPVIMLSAYTPSGADITIKALQYGAVDYVCKPSGEISLDIKKVRAELIEKIKAAVRVNVGTIPFNLPEEFKEKNRDKKEASEKNEVLVIIAASTGGPRALTEVIPKIPRGLSASFLVIQHMSEGFTKTLAERLNSTSMISVKEAVHGEILKAGTAYLAPGNFHMEIAKSGNDYTVELNQKPARLGVRPCADITFISAAKIFGGRVIGVVLTGMGKDGTVGSERLKEKDGTRIIAQNMETSVIYGMPKSVVEKGLADRVASITEIARVIAEEVENATEVKR